MYSLTIKTFFYKKHSFPSCVDFNKGNENFNKKYPLEFIQAKDQQKQYYQTKSFSLNFPSFPEITLRIFYKEKVKNNINGKFLLFVVPLPTNKANQNHSWSYPFPLGDNCHPSGRDKTMVARKKTTRNHGNSMVTIN